MIESKLDYILLSTDTNKMFYELLPIVCKAWKKLYPDVKIALSTVGTGKDFNALNKQAQLHVDWLETFDTSIGRLREIPIANVAKVARFIAGAQIAKTQPFAVCLIHDIDSAPLNRTITDTMINIREKYQIMTLGKNVYDRTEHEGKFPASHMIAEAFCFQQIFKKDASVSKERAFDAFVGIKEFDEKENIMNPPDGFSDESLVRYLISRNHDLPIRHYPRVWNIKTEFVDRSWWAVNADKLRGGGYLEVNFLRPFSDHIEQVRPVAEYILGRELDVDTDILRID